jgi:hypothetical protein
MELILTIAHLKLSMAVTMRYLGIEDKEVSGILMNEI